jgi:hypothetical protein
MIGRTLTLDEAAALLDRLSVMASLRFFPCRWCSLRERRALGSRTDSALALRR